MADKHWFHSKSPAAKKAYIAAHPKSIYAKEAKAARGDKQRAKTAKTDSAAHNANMKARREKREYEARQADRMERLAEKRAKLNAAPIRARVKPNR